MEHLRYSKMRHFAVAFKPESWKWSKNIILKWQGHASWNDILNVTNHHSTKSCIWTGAAASMQFQQNIVFILKLRSCRNQITFDMWTYADTFIISWDFIIPDAWQRWEINYTGDTRTKNTFSKMAKSLHRRKSIVGKKQASQGIQPNVFTG